MIGFIETRTLKHDACREQDSPYISATFRADGQRCIGHFLYGFETMATSFTKILIRWHTTVTPRWSYYACLILLALYYIACSLTIVNLFTDAIMKFTNQNRQCHAERELC